MTGCLYAALDMTDARRALLKAFTKLDSLKSAARPWVETRFTWRVCTDETVDFYHTTLARRNSAAEEAIKQTSPHAKQM